MLAGLDRETYKIVKKLGKRFTPALLPSDVTRGPVGICFDYNALMAAKHFPKYQYVEGIALDPDALRLGIKRWILHAWISDGVHAFDSTWQAIHNDTGEEFPVPSVYIGIPMDIIRVAAFMRLTGYQGVLANRWRSYDMVEDILEQTLKETIK